MEKSGGTVSSGSFGDVDRGVLDDVDGLVGSGVGGIVDSWLDSGVGGIVDSGLGSGVGGIVGLGVGLGVGGVVNSSLGSGVGGIVVGAGVSSLPTLLPPPQTQQASLAVYPSFLKVQPKSWHKRSRS